MEYEQPRIKPVGERDLFDPEQPLSDAGAGQWYYDPYMGWAQAPADAESAAADLGARVPVCWVQEDADGYVVRVELPGANPDDVDIQVGELELVVSADPGEAAEPAVGKPVYHGTLDFGTEVDPESATAHFDNGLLEVRVAKRAAPVRTSVKITARDEKD